MKRLLLSLVLMASVLSASAFGYDRAREQALFLSDKMAYELNLSQEQYDLAYQINLDYFLNVSSHRDIFGVYWQYRDADLRYILYDWQYSLYRTLDYFFQPLRWVNASWYFPVYSRYSRTHFYFGRPGPYISYRGGWRSHGYRSVSPYASHRPHSGRGLRDHHYPGAGRPGYYNNGGGHYNGHHNNGHYDGHHNNGYNNGQRNDGYRSNDRRDNGYGRSQGNVSGHNNGGQRSQGGHNSGSQRGQSSVGNQSRGGQSSVGGQSRGGQRGQSQAAPSSRNNSSSSRSSSTSSGRAGGRSYGR